ncbi:MAG: tetratricopeptide repeat protein [Candidatus Hermodarchaeota archaeon]
MSDSSKGELNRVEELIIEGRFALALQLVENLEKRERLTAADRLMCRLLKSTLLTKLGHFEEAFSFSRRMYQETKERGKPLKGINGLITSAEAVWRLGNLDKALEILSITDRLFERLSEEESEEIIRSKASSINLKGTVYLYKGELEQALQYYQQSLALFEELGNKQDIAYSLNNIGKVYWHIGDFDRVLDYYQQSLALFEELGNKKDIAGSFHNIGVIYWRKGEFDKALEYYQRSLAIKEKYASKEDIALSFNNIGVIFWHKGDLDQALDYFEQSLTIQKEFSEDRDIAACLNNIGTIYQQKGEFNQALKYHQQSLVLFEELGNKQDIARSLHNIGVIHWYKGDLNQALEYLERGLRIREKLISKQLIAHSLVSIGIVYWFKGDSRRALEYYQQSLALFEKLGNKPYISENLQFLISVALGKVSLREVERYLQRLQKISVREGEKIISQRSRVAEALVLEISTRTQYKDKTEELLKQMIEEEVVEHDLTVLTLLNLCDLLLGELETLDTQEGLKKIQTYVNRLFDIAQQQKSHWLLAGAYILQAKAAFVELRQSRAFAKEQELKHSLLKAQQLAQENQLSVLLARGHMLLALFYSFRKLFDEAEEEIQQAQLLLGDKTPPQEQRKLEEIQQKIKASKTIFLQTFAQTIESSKQEAEIAELEKEFMDSLDEYWKMVKSSLSTLRRKYT